MLRRAVQAGDPKQGALELIKDMAKNQDTTGLRTFEIYDALADGAGKFSARGLTFYMQARKHQFLSDIGACIVEIAGTLLILDFIRDKTKAGWERIQNARKVMSAFISATPGVGLLAVAKLGWETLTSSKKDEMFHDGSGVCNDDDPNLIASVAEAAVFGAVPFAGALGLVRGALGIDGGTAGAAQTSRPASKLQIQNTGEVEVGGMSLQPAPRQSVGSELRNRAFGLAERWIERQVGLSDVSPGEEEEDAGTDQVIAQAAAKFGLPYDQLRASYYSRHDEARDEARDEDGDLGFGLQV